MNRRDAILGTALVALSACARAPDAAAPQTGGSAAAAATPDPALPAMTVHKNVGCGCCDLWVEHMQQAGFTAEVHESSNMGPIKERLGVPFGMGSCHTAEVGGYFVEGHVPAREVLRLLRERPDAKGLTVPGMPIGSPGMEVQDRIDPYDVLLVARDGSTSIYAQYGT